MIFAIAALTFAAAGALAPQPAQAVEYPWCAIYAAATAARIALLDPSAIA